MNNKFCVFCGKVPLLKTSEHIIPQWLIELTGNPNRVVNFGIDYSNQRQIRFAWSQFKFPSCENCNNAFSQLESKIKPIIEDLMNLKAIPGNQYIMLLDWLDKIRIGLWLAYYYLLKNQFFINPSFYITNRLGKKDRMIAIYPISTSVKGISITGINTPAFHYMPSCFSIMINNLFIHNMSWDYMCSARCGFPYPHIMRRHNEMLKCSDFRKNSKIKHPIIRQKLFAPSILLFQPITDDKSLRDIRNNFETQGTLFKELSNEVHILKNLNELISFEKISKLQARYVYEYKAQVLDYQNLLMNIAIEQSINQCLEYKDAIKFNKKLIISLKHMRNE